MNPFEHNEPTNYFGKNLISGFLGSGRKSIKPSSYSRMKTKQIEKRRQRNKVAYKSRRYKRIRANKLHCKFFPI
jgi:hypothetical protein